ncbi:MAG TPA: hypothetical protein VI358_18120 [Pseudolabrys sp.]
MSPVDVYIEADGIPEDIDPETGAQQIEMPDGSVVIDFEPNRKQDVEDEFGMNLAEVLDSMELGRISQELLDGIEADDQSRSEWISTRAKGIDLLGLKLEDPRSDVANSSAPLEGMSTVRHPLLLEAVLRFQANARGELLPADGPVKIRNDGQKTMQSDLQCNALEDDMNHYLTTTASEYYPDTDRMLFLTGFGGMGFKKVYHCPIRNRPVSESVDAADIIVSNATTDLANAGRVTHRISMRKSTLRRMQLLGAYLDVSLTQPDPEPNRMQRKINQVQGTEAKPQRPEDQDYTLYECYAELDIKGYEHTQNGKVTGLPLPYKVTIEKTSRQVLEIRRNWKQDDPKFLAKKCFVCYQFVPGLGFYAFGLLHILGNTDNALTAAWRLLLDAGMFSNFPGFLYAKNGDTRQASNQFRVPPGGGAALQISGDDIRKMVMPLPYQQPGAAMMQLTDNIAQTGARLGGTAEIQVGEGRQDAPVGTTLALIEQATKIESAVHKRMHAAQAEEFQMLKELFKADPESLTRYDNNRAAWNEDVILNALNNFDMIPVADPNTASQLQRLMKATAIKQLQAQSPDLYDGRAVDMRVLSMMKVDDPESLFAPPAPAQQPAIDPVKMAQVHQKEMDSQRKYALGVGKLTQESQKAKDQEDMQLLKLAQTAAIHPDSNVTALDTARAAKGLVTG